MRLDEPPVATGERARGLVGDRIAGRRPRRLLLCGSESGEGAWAERRELLDVCFPKEEGGEGEEGEAAGDRGDGDEGVWVGAAVVDMDRTALVGTLDVPPSS
jgi:hypothetical protein